MVVVFFEDESAGKNYGVRLAQIKVLTMTGFRKPFHTSPPDHEI